METSIVQFGTTAIPYAILRSSRRRTVAIAIDPDRGVVVTAPKDAPIDKLDAVVHRKAQWITSRLRSKSTAPPPPDKEFVSGASFRYLGRQYRLKVQPGEVRRAEVRLLRGWLTVTTPPTAGPGTVGAAIVEWYRQHAAARLPARVAEWSPRVGVAPPTVLVRDQRKRWASCDKAGVLRVNWRVIQAPMQLVDYVVAHELVHLLHPDHTAEFWARLGRAMPDYERRRDRLREVGREYEW